jgi:hypothetical protein
VENLKFKLIHVLLLVFCIVVFAFGSGCIRSFEEESNYNIKDMDISADHIGNAFVELNVTTYVERYNGNTAKNSTLLLKAYSTGSGLLVAQKEVNLGVLKKGETKPVSLTVDLPKNGGYDLRSVLFEENSQKSNGEIKIYNLEALLADSQEIGLQIPTIDFKVNQVEGGKVSIESDIYLTNEGNENSKDFRMLVKVREMDAGLLADKVWTQTGEIQPEATVIRSVNLTIPDQYNYIVEVLIWNNDIIVKSGVGYVQLNPGVRIQDKNTTETRKIQTSDFENSTLTEKSQSADSDQLAVPEAIGSAPRSSNPTPGFSLSLSLILICLIVILRRRFSE